MVTVNGIQTYVCYEIGAWTGHTTKNQYTQVLILQMMGGYES